MKVGAYLTQELGFTNVSRLAGGIVAYDRSINGGQEQGTQSLFKGTNFVFDGRLGRQITDTAIGTCKTCGSKTSLISNCKNDNCHQRMVQCENCRSSFMGACSDACRTRVINSGKLKTVGGGAGNAGVTNCKNSYTTIGDYCTGYSSPTPPLFNEIVENTVAMLAKGCHMLSGTSQGRFLAALSSSSREGRILEIGTFSGYATSWFLEGATNAGEAIQCKRLGNRESGPYVLTLDRDQRALSLAVAHVRVLSAFGSGSDGAREARFIRTGASHILGK